MENVIEVLKKVFTHGDATNTHLDILDYLQSAGIPKEEYATWGRNHLTPHPSKAEEACGCKTDFAYIYEPCSKHRIRNNPTTKGGGGEGE